MKKRQIAGKLLNYWWPDVHLLCRFSILSDTLQLCSVLSSEYYSRLSLHPQWATCCHTGRKPQIESATVDDGNFWPCKRPPSIVLPTDYTYREQLQTSWCPRSIHEVQVCRRAKMSAKALREYDAKRLVTYFMREKQLEGVDALSSAQCVQVCYCVLTLLKYWSTVSSWLLRILHLLMSCLTTTCGLRNDSLLQSPISLSNEEAKPALSPWSLIGKE